jgi:hypothetical protein
MNRKLSDELNSFRELWKGGYYEGDPLNPISQSGYGRLNYMSVLHATYLRCIKPYLNENTISLEIGPGRGAWTKTLLPSKEVWVLDALSSEHNKFFEYLNYPSNVKYIQVEDFRCSMLPDNYFNYMFSFGTLCHVSFDGISEYAKNLYSKLKTGCNCFWMIADYDKYNNAVSNIEKYDVLRNFVHPSIGYQYPVALLLKLLQKLVPTPSMKNPHENDDPKPGRFYNAGIKKTKIMLEKIGYEVIDEDVGTNHRDPIIHFTKK